MDDEARITAEYGSFDPVVVIETGRTMRLDREEVP
jgi:hypothetical protein